MKELPIYSLWEKGTRFFRSIARLRIPVYASYASFFIVLSLFPSLVLLLSLVRYAGLGTENLTGLLEGIIPEALMPVAENLIYSAYRNASGALVSISAVTALWSASRGVHGLLTGLNAIYEVQENRGYLKTRSLSVLYTFLFLLVLVLTLVLSVFGNTLLQLPVFRESELVQFLKEVVLFRFLLLLGLQTLLFTAVFTVFPNRRNRFWDSLPGALMASAGWLIFSNLYSVYVERFAGYTSIYGSVYALALSMLWLYCCISIVFYGGVLNRLLMHKQ